jgi:hypothetical protein
MTYNETGSGGLFVFCCAATSGSHIFETAFSPRDVLYNVYKARHGIMERVVIKEIVPCKLYITQGLFRAMYRDTFNALWNEWDLVSFTDAQALAIAYWERLRDDLAALPLSC